MGSDSSLRARKPTSHEVAPRAKTVDQSILPPSFQDTVKKGRMPTNKPPFSVKDLHKAIPAHCFERPLWKSFGYLFVDLVIVAGLMYAATFIDGLFPNETYGARYGSLLRHCCWLAYWVICGNVMTGLWVIGHECGHHAFADSRLVCDVVGFITHSALLVPYFSWQVSHRRHHSKTGSIEHDEVFVPACMTAEEVAAADMKREQDDDNTFLHMLASVRRLFNIFTMMTLGWPLYLLINATGNKTYPREAWVNHFFPSSPIFTNDRERVLVFVSDIGLLVAFVALWKLSLVFGALNIVYFYVIPYLITNFYLVLITFLQHTHRSLPHYTNPEWDWLRGALATVDRDFGLSNYFHHHIADTHVLHHLFSYLPHYHAEEASEAIKPILGEYYAQDNTPIMQALWNSFELHRVSEDKEKKGVWWFYQ